MNDSVKPPALTLMAALPAVDWSTKVMAPLTMSVALPADELLENCTRLKSLVMVGVFEELLTMPLPWNSKSSLP